MCFVFSRWCQRCCWKCQRRGRAQPQEKPVSKRAALSEIMFHYDNLMTNPGRNISVGLRVMNCPFRSAWFLPEQPARMKSLRQFVLQDWKPNPPLERRAPWDGHHHAAPTHFTLQGWPRTKTPFTCMVYSPPGYTVMPRRFIPQLLDSCAEPLWWWCSL